MEHELDSELDYILRYRVLQTLYQPVIDSHDGRVFGYEALTRGPSNSPLHAPLPLIRAAARSGRLFELDLVCRELAIRRFQELGLPGCLFLNVSPLSLMEPTFRPGETLRLLHEVALAPQRVVIELTEQQPLEDYTVLKAAVAHYTEAGFQIAIDDLGAGYAGLRLWSELRPAYVKIDHHFTENIGGDGVKREFVRSIRDMSVRLGCKVVAEGIETEEDYQTVQSLGVRLHQGYHLGRPLPSPLRDQPVPVSKLPVQQEFKLSRYLNGLRRYSELKS